MKSLVGNREYLFDQVPALMFVFDHVNTIDELAAKFSKMSLVNQNLIGKPTTRMHILAGVLDTQVPFADINLLLTTGDLPKEAWINPKGGHLGRQMGVLPDAVIFKQVVIPWLVNALR